MIRIEDASIWQKETGDFAAGSLFVSDSTIANVEISLPSVPSGSGDLLQGKKAGLPPEKEQYLLPGFFDFSWEDESKLLRSRSAQEDKFAQGVTTLEILCPPETEVFRQIMETYPGPGEKGQHLRLILHAVISVGESCTNSEAEAVATLVRFLQTGLQTGMGTPFVRMGGMYMEIDAPDGLLLMAPETCQRVASLAHANHLQLSLRAHQANNLSILIEAVECALTYPGGVKLHHRIVDPPVINESLLAICETLSLTLLIQGSSIMQRWRPLKHKKPNGHYLSLSRWITGSNFSLISGGDYPSGLGMWKAATEQLYTVTLQELKNSHSEQRERINQDQFLHNWERQVKVACLLACTHHPAVQHHLSTRLGVLQEGAWADLLVLSSNPLEENERLNLYPHMAGVMTNGKWVAFA